LNTTNGPYDQLTFTHWSRLDRILGQRDKAGFRRVKSLRLNLRVAAGVILVIAAGILALAAGRGSASIDRQPPAHRPAASSTVRLEPGDGYLHGGSARVRDLQRDLRGLGYRPGRADGLFGPRTEHAVRRFQREHGLVVDGIVGPKSLAALRSLSGRKRPLVAAPTPQPEVLERARAARAVPPRPALAVPGSGLPTGSTIPGAITLFLIVALTSAGAALITAGRRKARTAPGRARTQSFGRPAPALRPDVVGEATPVAMRSDGERLGVVLRGMGAVTDESLGEGLRYQVLSGGRLGEILTAYEFVPEATVTTGLARQLGIETLRPEDEPVPLLSVTQARESRAVALDGNGTRDGAIAVALVDHSPARLAKLEAQLERPVEPRLCNDGMLDTLLARAYGDVDAYEVTRALREESPDLSASRTTLSRPQLIAACLLGFVALVGLAIDVAFIAAVLAGLATAFFVTSTGFRLYAAWEGYRPGATIDPPGSEISELEERSLPVYTILLPLYKEKPSTVGALFKALSEIDYPKHKLDGLLLIEADDAQTRSAIEEVGRPAWMRVLPLPPGTPRTKPRAMGVGLRYARGTVLTVYDAEDKPDPDQLKKAVWTFQRADESLACVQAKLGYYNPRQNLLTRWFTLEYDAWFNIFLPGLHRMGAPIPLGGTSNHFRREALEACLGWDPYNVTEDADLGLRFARLGFTTAMLESTTGEEANSRVPNWVRQRSRWSKGYMQTLLVHTRRPRKLLSA
jgi:peptidoglycan hydrolase-like protein with peptidoglycan-binding domain